MPNNISLLLVTLKGESKPVAVRWYPGGQHMYRVNDAGLSVGTPFGVSKIAMWAYAKIG